MKGKIPNIKLGSKPSSKDATETPGPGDYSPLGPDHGPVLTIAQKLPTRPKEIGPGPADYNVPPAQAGPAITIAVRRPTVNN